MDGIRKGARRMVRLGTAAALLVSGVVAASPSIAPAAAATVKVNATVVSSAAALAAPVVGVAATPTGHGYWRVAKDGGILTAGDAHYYGSAAGKWHDTVVAMAATPSGKGYWIVDRRGIVYAFGNAPFRGDLRAKPLNRPIVGIASTPNGQGYWMVASDGGIFTFNAPYKGSMGGHRLNRPVVGMAATTNGTGYWLVASDGGMFTFNAPFKGSMGGHPLNKPIVGMGPAPGGQGYTLVGADGGLFRFGSNVPFFGSAANACPGASAVGVAMSPGAVGYWIAFGNAVTYAFSPATHPPVCGPAGDSKAAQIQRDFFARLNAERAGRGLPGVQWDPTLANYATRWSGDMAANGFRHSNIGVLLGPYNYVGENIAKGSINMLVGALHRAWMQSQGHRDNILAPGFTKVGIGVVCVPGDAVYITENFGRLTSQGGFPTKTWPQDPIKRPDDGSLTC